MGAGNDASIFAQLEIGIALNNSDMDLLEPKILNGFALPHILVADEIFKLETWLMKPYPERNPTTTRAVFN